MAGRASAWPSNDRLVGTSKVNYQAVYIFTLQAQATRPLNSPSRIKPWTPLPASPTGAVGIGIYGHASRCTITRRSCVSMYICIRRARFTFYTLRALIVQRQSCFLRNLRTRMSHTRYQSFNIGVRASVEKHVLLLPLQCGSISMLKTNH